MSACSRVLALAFAGLSMLSIPTAHAAAPGSGGSNPPASGTAAQQQLWRDVAEADIARGQARRIVPQVYRTVALDSARLGTLLRTAPAEGSVDVRSSPLTLVLPMPDGKLAGFRIVESPIMAPELAAKYPEIRTYLGQGVDDPTASLRFDVTPAGFHAQVLSTSGTVYIDPYQINDTDSYVVYAKRDYAKAHQPFVCQVTGSEVEPDSPLTIDSLPAPAVSSGGTLRTFRLALAATGEYTQFQGGTVAAALGGMVTTMNRINGIYEREVSVRMVLIANTDLLIYTNGLTDPYTNDDGGSLLGENQANVDGIIGDGNYDIGHIFSTGGGGIASLGSVCAAGEKAQGVTGSPVPVGDAYDVDYVAHEMGHQFNANHTFNSAQDNCGGGNRSATNAYETGSGVTIMAYAGICGSEDLQPNSEDHFHRRSLNSILAFVGTGCGVPTTTGNTPPVVTAPAALTIPVQTPFTLTAAGSDADLDTLSYIWEEFDLGAQTTGGGQLVDNGTRPLFRVFSPTTSSSRTLPSLRYVLANANVPPVTAPLPGTSTPSFYTGETMATTSRTLNFRVTARDNRAGGGGTNEASTALTVTNTAGPFAVTNPNTAITWAAGSTQPVAWSVANTSIAPVSAANVSVLLSTDGGNSFPTVLAGSVPNNGTANVSVPAGVAATTQARVRVEAVGNIFFDVSDANFIITNGANTPPAIVVTTPLATRQGSPPATGAVATVTDVQDAAGTLGVSVSGAPPELIVSAVNTAGTINLTATASCLLVTPTGGDKTYPVLLTVTDSAGGTSSAFVNVNVGTNNVPTIGTYAAQLVIRSTTTNVTPSAPPADANNNFTGVSVTPTTLPGGGSVSVAANGVVTAITNATTTFGAYPVRVSATDSCGATKTSGFTLTVASANPVVGLASSAVTSGNTVIEPNECNTVNVVLNNSGGTAANAVGATLTTSTPGVTIFQAASAYPNLAPGGTGTNSTAFQISTSSSVACFTNIALTQTVTYTGTGSPTTLNFNLPVGVAAGTNYQFTASTGATVPAGGTLIAASQDDDAVVSITVPAGFNFSVYGTAVTGGSVITASTNGNVQFAATGTEAWSNTPLPASSTGGASGAFPPTGPTVFAYWDDLDTTGAGNGIFTDLTGSAPNRTFKVQWRGKVLNQAGAPLVNFALLFREGSNLFDIVYGNAAAANGIEGTIGIQAASSGTAFTQFSHNSASIGTGTKLTAGFAAAVCNVGPGICGAPPVDPIFSNGFETP